MALSDTKVSGSLRNCLVVMLIVAETKFKKKQHIYSRVIIWKAKNLVPWDKKLLQCTDVILKMLNCETKTTISTERISSCNLTSQISACVFTLLALCFFVSPITQRLILPYLLLYKKQTRVQKSCRRIKIHYYQSIQLSLQLVSLMPTFIRHEICVYDLQQFDHYGFYLNVRSTA